MKKIVSIVIIIILLILATSPAFAKGELYEEQLIMDDLNIAIREANQFDKRLRIVECRFIQDELILAFSKEYRSIGEDVFLLLEICSIEDAKQVVLYCEDD